MGWNTLSLCVYICIYSMYVYGILYLYEYVCTCACMQRPEIDVQCLSHLPSTIQDLSLDPELRDLVRLGGQRAVPNS